MKGAFHGRDRPGVTGLQPGPGIDGSVTTGMGLCLQGCMPDYVHATPGRLRIKTAALRSPAVARNMRADILAVADVASVTMNPSTGSCTILYDPQRLGSGSLWAALCRRGLVAGREPEPVSIRATPSWNQPWPGAPCAAA